MIESVATPGAEAVIAFVSGIVTASGIAVWVYLDERKTVRRRLLKHSEEIKDLQEQMALLKVIQNDVHWIRETMQQRRGD